MLIRSALAALDFNFNVQRKSKVSADGKPMYKMKVCYNLAGAKLGSALAWLRLSF